VTTCEEFLISSSKLLGEIEGFLSRLGRPRGMVVCHLPAGQGTFGRRGIGSVSGDFPNRPHQMRVGVILSSPIRPGRDLI
jgi:hypothetical protein